MSLQQSPGTVIANQFGVAQDSGQVYRMHVDRAAWQQSGVIITNDALDLDIIRSNRGKSEHEIGSSGILLAMWHAGTPQDAQDCLDGFGGFEGLMASVSSEKRTTAGHLSHKFKPEQLIAYSRDLMPLVERGYALRGKYNGATGNDTSKMDIEITLPNNRRHYATTLHRDVGTKDQTAGLCIDRSSTAKGGEFLYVSRDHIWSIYPTDEFQSEFSGGSPHTITKMPIGAFGIIQHGDRGLVHSSSMITDGVRCKYTIEP